MPLLKMLMPNDVEWLVELTPERIQTTEEVKRGELVERFRRVLEDCVQTTYETVPYMHIEGY